jgi:lambda family phage minor tail protein L
MQIGQSLQNPSTSPIVELFMLADYNPTIPAEVFRFTNWRTCNFLGENWTHIDAKTSEFSSDGKSLPHPKIQVSNISNTIGQLCDTYRDFVGATLTRYRTPESFISAGSFDLIQAESWTIQQKTTHTNMAIEWELSAVELENRKIPNRAYRSTYCGVDAYRGSACGYMGPPVADINNNPTTNPALDQCSRTIGGCRLRFGQGQGIELPIDYFPGLTNV